MSILKHHITHLLQTTIIRFVIVLLGTTALNHTYAQTATTQIVKHQSKADKLFYSLRYIQAIDAYQWELNKKPNNKVALKNVGTCYRKLNDFTNAEKIYATLTVIDSLDALNFLYYAQSLAANQKYNPANIAYQKYATLKSDDTRGTSFTKAYGNLLNFFKDSSSISIELLNINSGQSDFSPAYYKKGLVFCSNRYEGQIVKRVFEWNQSAFLDLYYIEDTATIKAATETTLAPGDYKRRIQRTNDDDTYATSNDNATIGYMNLNYKDTSGMFTKPQGNVVRFSKTLSSKYHEGPLVFFSNGDSLFFTRNNYNDGKYEKGADGINKIKLYSATYKPNDSSWKNIKEFPFNNNNYSTGHPAIAPGDSILYFVSDMPGGFGGTDIYRSYYRYGNWSAPENMGMPINTEGNEMFPFIDTENTLYFASDGHPGLGGLDLFKISLSKQGLVKNLGYPANSNFDDFGLIINPETKTGYFSSNRRRGLSDDDIYSIQFKDLFYIQVVDGLTKEPLLVSNILVSEILSHDTLSNDSIEPGKFKADLKNASRYEILALAPGYASNTIFATADANNPLMTIPLFKPECIIAGTITDKDTKLPIQGTHIFIYDVTAKDTIYDYTVEYNGKYRYINLKPNHQYSLNASKEGYFNKPPILINTQNHKCGTDPEKEYDYLGNFELEKIIIGRAIKIDNIYFDLGKATIRPKSAKELDKIVKMMQNNPSIIIELSSHTDCRSSFQYNLTLSDKRAKASANYIISKGIIAERITGKGYGETKLVNDCACEGKVISRKCTEAEHQANRRTEFQVTGFITDTNGIEDEPIENTPGFTSFGKIMFGSR